MEEGCGFGVRSGAPPGKRKKNTVKLVYVLLLRVSTSDTGTGNFPTLQGRKLRGSDDTRVVFVDATFLKRKKASNSPHMRWRTQELVKPSRQSDKRDQSTQYER